MTNIFSPKRNFYISYLKGLAIIYMIIIHLTDWSEIKLGFTPSLLKEILHTSLIFFVSLTGANIIMAYGNYDTLNKPIKKLYKRVLILTGIYFLYNIIKYFIFDFSTSLFYMQFIEKGTFNVSGLLTLRSFTTPITVLIMDSIFLILSPILLYVNKHVKYKKSLITGLIITLLIINYVIIVPNYIPFNPNASVFPIQQNFLLDILYANNYVMFPIALWAVPYLVGVLLAMSGFEKSRNEATLIFACITIALGYMKLANNESLLLNPYIFPLMPYYIFICFFALFVFIQIFIWLEKSKSRKIYAILSAMRYYGDHSLKIYVYHWMVIDLSIRIFYPHLMMMWLMMLIYMAFITYMKRDTIKDYYDYGYTSGHYRMKDGKRKPHNESDRTYAKIDG